MKTYKIRFECQSRMNKIPDAQTIFGAICSIYKNVYGEQAFKDYLDSFQSTPLFIHSSLFPENLFPMVKESMFNVELVNRQTLKEDKADQIATLAKLKKYKKISYISESVMKDYIFKATENIDPLKGNLLNCPQNFSIENGILRYAKENVGFDHVSTLVTHVKVDKMNVEGENRDLYYDNALFCKRGQIFVMFVKTDLPAEEIEKVLKYIEYFPLGSRGTTGNNVFKYVGCERYNVENKYKKDVLLSKCIPNKNEFDYKNSSYGVYSDQYHSSKFYKNQIVGRISKLVEGSLMYPTTKKEYYGQLLNVSDDENPLYHYGIGFVL